MNQLELIRALESMAAHKRIKKNSLAYKTVLAAINNPGVPQVCGKEIGGGRNSSSKSWRNECVIALAYIGAVFTAENVAPRGGKAGDRITINL